jgi:hypothetical protein
MGLKKVMNLKIVVMMVARPLIALFFLGQKPKVQSYRF